ncbi:MAG: hypothetical protein ACOC2W_04095 [bacterium]
MNNDNTLSLLDKIIIDFIKESKGCKITELGINLISKLHNKDYANELQKKLEVSELFELIDIKTDLSEQMIALKIEYLININELVAIDYMLPDINYIKILKKW